MGLVEKMKSLKNSFSIVKSTNCALVAFSCFTIKMLVVQPSIADSIILLGLGAVYGYSQYLKRFQPYKLDEAVMKDLVEVKGALMKLNMVRATEKLEGKKYF